MIKNLRISELFIPKGLIRFAKQTKFSDSQILDKNILLLLFTIHCSLVIISCGPDGDHFEMNGQFKGFKQGELYVYATDGPSQKLDTIAIVNGSFEYSAVLDGPRTYIIVFP